MGQLLGIEVGNSNIKLVQGIKREDSPCSKSWDYSYP